MRKVYSLDDEPNIDNVTEYAKAKLAALGKLLGG